MLFDRPTDLIDWMSIKCSSFILLLAEVVQRAEAPQSLLSLSHPPRGLHDGLGDRALARQGMLDQVVPDRGGRRRQGFVGHGQQAARRVVEQVPAERLERRPGGHWRRGDGVDGLPVEASTKYKLDAGQCESCGYYKTWGFKVQNKKSGKMMPGHVTAEGYKIGEGDCPKWANIAAANKKRSERKTTAAAPPAAPPAPGAWIQDINHPMASAVNSGAMATAAAPAPAPAARITPQFVPPSTNGNEPGHVVAFNVNGISVTTTIAEGMAIIEQISACVRKALGTGA